MGGSPFQATARSGADGTFGFTDLPDLQFTLRVFKSRGSAVTHARLSDIRGDGKPLTITLAR